MGQGDFTKEEADHVIETVCELHKGLAKKKQFDYLGHLNDILLFIEAAKRNAPGETK